MKNSNLNKPIIFIDKKAELEGKHTVSKLHASRLSKGSKVIGYQEHKKMKIHEAKKEKILNSKLYKLRRKITTAVVVIFCLGILFLLWNKFIKPSYLETSNTGFKVESESISSSDMSTYTSIIKESVQKHLGIKYNVKIEQIHKNGNLVFARGFFTIPEKGDIYYDMVLQNYSPYSLTVNGEEYIKK